MIGICFSFDDNFNTRYGEISPLDSNDNNNDNNDDDDDDNNNDDLCVCNGYGMDITPSFPLSSHSLIMDKYILNIVWCKYISYQLSSLLIQHPHQHHHPHHHPHHSRPWIRPILHLYHLRNSQREVLIIIMRR